MADVIAVCNSLDELKTATKKLDKARLCSLKIDDGGVVKDVKNFKGIYNISSGKMAAAVVPYYNLIQHKGYFDLFGEALGRLNIEFTATLKACNNRAFGDFDFKGRNLKFTKLNEEFTTGIRIINSYNKSSGITVAPRFTRLACTNGMILTRAEKVVSIKHTAKIAKEIEVLVEKRLNALISTYSDLENWVSGSMKDSVEWLTCCKIIEKLFAQPIHREKILTNLGISMIVVTDKKSKKKSITYVLDDNKKKKEKISRWKIYNAITRYLSHGEQITPHIESLFHKQAERLLMTPLAKMPMAEIVIN